MNDQQLERVKCLLDLLYVRLLANNIVCFISYIAGSACIFVSLCVTTIKDSPSNTVTEKKEENVKKLENKKGKKSV